MHCTAKRVMSAWRFFSIPLVLLSLFMGVFGLGITVTDFLGAYHMSLHFQCFLFIFFILYSTSHSLAGFLF
jgi:hypothetical protein